MLLFNKIKMEEKVLEKIFQNILCYCLTAECVRKAQENN